MKKLRLQVESLRVESFTTREQPGHRGTVNGQQCADTAGSCPATLYISQCPSYCASNCYPYCPSAETCAQTCACQSKPSACHDCEM